MLLQGSCRGSWLCCTLFSTPKKADEQRKPCGCLRALEHNYLSGFMEKKDKELGI